MALKSEEEIISLYNSPNRRILINKFAEIYFSILYMKFDNLSQRAS